MAQIRGVCAMRVRGIVLVGEESRCQRRDERGMLKNVEGVKHKRHGNERRQLGTLKGINDLVLDVSLRESLVPSSFR